MKTLRRFLYREILTSVGFATLAFLALFFFFDMVDELRWVSSAAARRLRSPRSRSACQPAAAPRS